MCYWVDERFMRNAQKIKVAPSPHYFRVVNHKGYLNTYYSVKFIPNRMLIYDIAQLHNFLYHRLDAIFIHITCLLVATQPLHNICIHIPYNDGPPCLAKIIGQSRSCSSSMYNIYDKSKWYGLSPS